MNKKRAFRLSLFLYICLVFSSLIIGFLTGASLSKPLTILQWSLITILSIIFTFIAAFWYFEKVKPSLVEGLDFSAVFFVTASILDAIVFLILFFLGYNILALITPLVLASLLLILATPLLLGMVLSKLYH